MNAITTTALMNSWELFNAKLTAAKEGVARLQPGKQTKRYQTRLDALKVQYGVYIPTDEETALRYFTESLEHALAQRKATIAKCLARITGDSLENGRALMYTLEWKLGELAEAAAELAVYELVEFEIKNGDGSYGHARKCVDAARLRLTDTLIDKAGTGTSTSAFANILTATTAQVSAQFLRRGMGISLRDVGTTEKFEESAARLAELHAAVDTLLADLNVTL